MRTGTVVPGFVAVTICTSSSLFFTGLPLKARITSPGSRPALSAALPSVTVLTSAPVRSFSPSSSSGVAIDRPDADADAAARDLAGAQLRQQLADGVARDREADAHVALRHAGRGDRRVDADHLAAKVQQRTAGVPRIDRRVGLEDVGESLFGHRQVRRAVGADDADADGVREAERVADRHHPVARLHLRRVAELDHRQLVIRLLRSARSARCRSADRGRRCAPRSPDPRPRRRATPRSSWRPRRRGCWSG